MNDPINWLLFLAVNGLALYSSRSLTAYLNRGDRSFALSLLTTGIVYLTQVTLVVLALGVVFRQLDRTTVLASSVGLSIAILAAFRRRRRPFLSDLRYAWQGVARQADVFVHVVGLLFVVEVLILLAKVVWLPPHVWDVFYYHLTPAVEWFQRGYIPFAIDTPATQMNRVPLGMTVLSYWFFVFFGDDFLVNLPQTIWALLVAPLAYGLLRLGQVDRPWAVKFAVLAFFTPFVLMQAITSKDHLGLAVAFLSGLFMLASYLQRQDARMLVTAGMAFGLMLGFKTAGVALFGIAVVLFGVFLYVRRQDVLAIEAKRLALIRNLSFASLAILFLSLFWYVRGFFSRVPVSAALPPPRALPEGGGEAGRFGVDALWHNLQAFVVRVFDFKAGYTADLIGISGFGPQFAGFGLIALFVALVLILRRRSYRRPELFWVVAVAVAFVAFLVSHYSANVNSYRILVFLPIAMIAFAGILACRLGLHKAPLTALAMNLALTACIAWDLFTVLPPPLTNHREFRAFMTAPTSYRTAGTYTQWFSLVRPDFHRLLDALPVGSPIAVVSPPQFNRLFRKGQSETWSYPYYDRHWQRRLVYFKAREDLDCDAERLICRPGESLKRGLDKAGLHLVSTCPTNRCVALDDPDFYEITPGFYYYRGRDQGPKT